MALDETAEDNSLGFYAQAIIQLAHSGQVNQLTSFLSGLSACALLAIKYFDFHPCL